MEHWVDLEATYWFWTQGLWTDNLVPSPLGQCFVLEIHRSSYQLASYWESVLIFWIIAIKKFLEESLFYTVPNECQYFQIGANYREIFYPELKFQHNTWYKFWDQSPLPPLSMLFSSIWDSFLAQASLLLLFQYVATLSRGKGPDLFLQSEFPYSRISLNFSRNWLGLDNFCEISLQNLRKLGSYFVFRQFLKNIWDTCSMLKCCDT